MQLFSQLRPLLRIAKALESIAHALTYFAVSDARENGRIFMSTGKKWNGKDESELMHTDSEAIAKLREQDMELILQRGIGALEAQEDYDA